MFTDTPCKFYEENHFLHNPLPLKMTSGLVRLVSLSLPRRACWCLDVPLQ